MPTMRRILLSLLLFSFGSPTWAVDLQATLDRTRIVEGESLNLRVVASGNSQGNPDFTVLAKDFEILSQALSTRMTIINGQSNSTREWQLVIMPKRPGDLILPALQLGSVSSRPLKIRVLAENQAGKVGKARPVLLEVETNTKAPYVQSQVVYTLRILSQVPMKRLKLREPKAENAIFERLGEDIDYDAKRNGEHYSVIERRYAIFPQRSGPLTIDPPVFTALVPEPKGRNMVLRDPFFGLPFGDPFGSLSTPFTRPIRVRGHGIILDVKPQPAGTNSPWLPAKKLQLSEAWLPDPPTLRVGESVTRILTITALGLGAAQLPELNFPLPDGINVYPDKTQSATKSADDDLIAIKIFKQLLRPAKAGTFILPEISLSWWNTKTEQPQVARIPQRTIKVLPAVGQPNTQNTQNNAINAPSHPEPQVVPKTEPPKPAPLAVPSAPHSETTNIWMWIAGIFGLAWVLTLVLLFWDRWRNGLTPPQHTPAAISLAKAKTQIEQSCRANDLRAARTALLAWAAVRWPKQPPKRLDALAAYCDADTIMVLQELDRQLYAANATATWDGKAAWQALAPLINSKSKHQAKPTSPLPDLYPFAAK